MKSHGRRHDRIVFDALIQHIDAHPEVLCPVDAGLVGRIHTLIAGVEVDLNQELPSEFDDAGMP